MSDTSYYIVALFAGAALGFFFFGGLWLTIQKMQDTRHQALLLIGSFFGRTAVTLAGLFLAAAGRWDRLILAVLGFVLVRMVMIRIVQSSKSTLEEVETHAVKS